MSQTSGLASSIKPPSVSGFHAAAQEASRTGGQLVVNNQGQFAVQRRSWLGRVVQQLKQRMSPNRVSEQNQRVLYSLAYALRSEKNISQYQNLRDLTVQVTRRGANAAQLAGELEKAVSGYEQTLGPDAMRQRDGKNAERAQDHAETFMTGYFQQKTLDASQEHKSLSFSASMATPMRPPADRISKEDFHAAAMQHKPAFMSFVGQLSKELKNTNWSPGTENIAGAAPCKTPEGHFTDAFLLRALNMTVRQESRVGGGKEKKFLSSETHASQQTDRWLVRRYREGRANRANGISE